MERGINLDPKRSPFPDGGELGGLIVGEPERRQVFVLTCEVSEPRDNYGDFSDEEGEGLAEEDEICVAVSTNVNGVGAQIVYWDVVELTQ